MRLFDGPNEFTTTLKKALSEIDEDWENYKGLIVPGSHTPSQVEEKIEAIKEARQSFDERKGGLPTLLICFGFQLGAIEYARNVLGIKDATSEEFGQGTFVVKKRPALKVGEKDGESYWSNYEVVIEWDWPKNFFATPYHPEYQSSLVKQHPFLVSFLKYAREATYST